MYNDKIDDIFNVKKMEKTINRAKRRANWKMVLIAVIVLIIVTIGGAFGNRGITEKIEEPARYSAIALNEISSPNNFIGKHEQSHGFLGGENRYTTYKIIEGKVVYTGEERYQYGLFRNKKMSSTEISWPLLIGGGSRSEGDLQKLHYNELGQREMVFFYPFLQYETYRNDLELLNEIGENKVMEVALSFDRGYTYEEMQSLIPSDTTLTWLWVDDVDEGDEHFQVEQLDDKGKVIGYSHALRSEQDVYGLSLIDENGDVKEKPVHRFIGAIEAGQKLSGRWKWEFRRLCERLAGEDGQLTEEDLQYYGAVVTGDPQSLSQLKDLPFIKASSIGVITDKY